MIHSDCLKYECTVKYGEDSKKAVEKRLIRTNICKYTLREAKVRFFSQLKIESCCVFCCQYVFCFALLKLSVVTICFKHAASTVTTSLKQKIAHKMGSLFIQCKHTCMNYNMIAMFHSSVVVMLPRHSSFKLTWRHSCYLLWLYRLCKVWYLFMLHRH